MEQIAFELHRPVRRNFVRKHFKLEGIGDTWQMDLMDLNNLSKENGGFSYILVVIDVFTKFVWTRPVKNKTAINVRDALADIITKSPYGAPKNIHSDEGKEFTNTVCRSLYSKYDINFYQTYTAMKASIAERVIRTLKNKMFRRFTVQHNQKWMSILQKITNEYNNTVHRTTNMKPIDVKNKEDVEKIKQFMIDHLNIPPNKVPLKIGDYVRISKYKSVFAKGYTANWTTEIFQITNVFKGKPTTYTLEDADGEEIVGKFYGEELQKTDFPDTYLLEKIISKNLQKGTAIVKFLGFEKPEEISLNLLPKNL